jgi:hypothetical protein
MRLDTGGYTPLAPYSDENDTTFAHNTLCPRYAENDLTSAPPSPASIESFDVLDSIPWRRSYISLGNETNHSTLRRRWRKHRARAIAVILLFTLLCLGCGTGVSIALQRRQNKGAT